MRRDWPAMRWIWQNLPNLLSGARLAGAGVLLALAALGTANLFGWVLLGCMLSDVADGWLARRLKLASAFGATLDSIADVMTMLGGAVGLAVFQWTFVTEHLTGLLGVLSFYALEVVAALLRYGKVSSFHTLLDRASACSAGAFVMVLFLFGFRGWLYALTVVLYASALTEEMLLIFLLPQWRSDVGGVYRVLTAGALPVRTGMGNGSGGWRVLQLANKGRSKPGARARCFDGGTNS